jgi:hypothetical protein
MKNVLAGKGHWIGGTVVGLIGVAAVRMLAPGLEDPMKKAVLTAGYLLALSGIAIIALGVKRQADQRMKSSPASDRPVSMERVCSGHGPAGRIDGFVWLSA